MASKVELWVSYGKNARLFHKLRQLLPRMDEPNRKLLLFAAEKMVQQRKRRKSG
jgi:hypothetical protein